LPLAQQSDAPWCQARHSGSRQSATGSKLRHVTP
jgi:hypothetical protein